jgi:hypothetical protein
MKNSQRKAMFAKKKWKLYASVSDENHSVFVESFNSKSDAVNHVHRLDELFDRDYSKFRYNHSFDLWSDDTSNEGFVITKTKPPDADD